MGAIARLRRTDRPSRRHAPAVAPAGADPFDDFDDDALAVLIEAAEDVLRKAAPTVSEATVARWARPIRRELKRLADDVDAVASRIEVRRSWWVRKASPSEFDVPPAIWARFEVGLRDVLEQMYDEVGADAFGSIGEDLGVNLDYGERATIGNLEDEIGTAVTRISEASRQQLADAVDTSVNRGYSVEQLVGGVKGDSFAGIRGMVAQWQAIAPVNTTTDRATLIALTETAHANNYATIDGYRLSGLVQEVNVFDGASCGWTTHTDSTLANGLRVPLDEARAHPTSHPHCQRAFGAIVAGAPEAGRPGAQVVRPPRSGPLPPASELELRARAIAAQRFSQAARAEGATTTALRDLERVTGGHLDGLNFRLKTDLERTVDKITGDVLAGDSLDVARKVKDALRYTMVLDEKAYWSGIQSTYRELTSQGYSLIKFKDNWTNPLSHDVNSAWRAPDGTRFEFQFHTETSLARKMKGDPATGRRASHSIYDELRALPPEDSADRARLEAELRDLWNDVPAPTGLPWSAFKLDPDRGP